MTRDELLKRLDDTLMLSNPRIVPNDLMPDIDAYVATERAEIEQQIAEHVRTRLAADRERIAQAIEQLIPDAHEHHEMCADCWAVREAARIARAEQ